MTSTPASKIPDSPSPRSVGAPIEYFSADQWPFGIPRCDAPRAVLYAAEFACFLHLQVGKYGGTLNHGLRQLEKSTGLSPKTLRPIADGVRWPGLALVAQVEEIFAAETTGYGAVLRRIDHQRRKQDSEPA